MVKVNIYVRVGPRVFYRLFVPLPALPPRGNVLIVISVGGVGRLFAVGVIKPIEEGLEYVCVAATCAFGQDLRVEDFEGDEKWKEASAQEIPHEFYQFFGI